MYFFYKVFTANLLMDHSATYKVLSIPNAMQKLCKMHHQICECRTMIFKRK